MKAGLGNWNIMRVLRLAMGILIVIQGIYAREWFLIGAGSLFSLIPLLNRGCCGMAACYTPVQKGSKKQERISDEEVR